MILVGCGLAGCGVSPTVRTEPPAVETNGRSEKPAAVKAVADSVPANAEVKPAPAKEKSTAPSAAKEGFPFPADKAGRLVAETLKPREDHFTPDAGKPKAQSARNAVETPELPLPQFDGQMIPISPAVVVARPRPLPLADGTPLAHEQPDRRLPQPVKLAAGALVRLPAPDGEQPPELPILARPQADRGPTDDPTAETSQSAALAAPIPVRTNQTPFERLTVPDPFEHRHAAELRLAPREELPPPLPVPQTPPKSLAEKGR
jgi:hypothetical protein